LAMSTFLLWDNGRCTLSGSINKVECLALMFFVTPE
jgi:hypothetical protein